MRSDGRGQGNCKIYDTVSASQLHSCNSSPEPFLSGPACPQAVANLPGMLSRMGFNKDPTSPTLFTRYMDSCSGKRSRSLRAQKILGTDRPVMFDVVGVPVNRVTVFWTALYVSEPSRVYSSNIACTVSNAIRLSFGKW